MQYQDDQGHWRKLLGIELTPSRNITPLGRKILSLMGLYRMLARARGAQIRDQGIPQVFFSSTFRNFEALHKTLEAAAVEPRLFIQAQFKFWLDDPDYPYPRVDQICDFGTVLFVAWERWRQYEAYLRENYPAGDWRKEAEEVQPLYDAEFSDCLFKLDFFKAHTKKALSDDEAMLAVVDLLSPAFIAAHENFCRQYLPSLKGRRFDEVRSILTTCYRDPYLKAQLESALTRALMNREVDE